MRVQLVVAELKKQDTKSEHLDEAVHAAASEAATGANNGGLEDQVRFLLSQDNWTTADVIFKAKEGREAG